MAETWVLECVTPVARVARRVGRVVVRKKVVTGIGVGAAGTAAVHVARPPKPIRQGGLVCEWRYVSTPDYPLYGGALPSDFAGLPSYAGGYPSGFAGLGDSGLSPGYLAARDYANNLVGGGFLGGGFLGGGLIGSGGGRQTGTGDQTNTGGQTGGGNSGQNGGGYESVVDVKPPIEKPTTDVYEPWSIAMFAVGLVALWAVRRRRV